MRYGTKNIDWLEIGAMLANESDIEQAALLSSFCKELRKACGTHHNTEMQMCYIQHKLSKEDQELIAVCCTGETDNG